MAINVHFSYDVKSSSIDKEFKNYENARKYILAFFKNLHFSLDYYPCETTLVFSSETSIWFTVRQNNENMLNKHFNYLITTIEYMPDNSNLKGYFCQNPNLNYKDLISFYNNMTQEDIDNYLNYKF